VCWVVENILGELRASCSGVDNHFMPTETHEHGNGVQTKTPSGGGGGNGANVRRSNSSHRKKLLIACWGVYLETRNNEKKSPRHSTDWVRATNSSVVPTPWLTQGKKLGVHRSFLQFSTSIRHVSGFIQCVQRVSEQ